MIIRLRSWGIIFVVTAWHLLLTVLRHHWSHLVVLVIRSTSLVINLLIQSRLLIIILPITRVSSQLVWLLTLTVSWVIVSSLSVHIVLIIFTRSILLIALNHIFLFLRRSLPHWRWHPKPILMILRIHIVRIHLRLLLKWVNRKVMGASSCAGYPWWSNCSLIENIILIISNHRVVSILIILLRRLNRWILLLRLLPNAWGIFLFPHFLVKVPVLLEPVSIHPGPLGLHQSNDWVKLSLPSQIVILLILVEVESLSIVEEDRLVIWPKVVDELIRRWVGFVSNLPDKPSELLNLVTLNLLNKPLLSLLLFDLKRSLKVWILLFSQLCDPDPLSFSDMLVLNLVL